jgi:hypothetical protein
MTQSLKAANDETPGLLTVRGQRPISPEMLEMDTPLSNFMGGNHVIETHLALLKRESSAFLNQCKAM